MELLKCPKCGKKPSLVQAEETFKYFCSVHASCGNWETSEGLAAKQWNRRVEEYEKEEATDIENASDKRVLELELTLKRLLEFCEYTSSNPCCCEELNEDKTKKELCGYCYAEKVLNN